MIPSCKAELPESTGSHEPEMMCHTTGMEVEPNVTAHLAVPSTGMGELLYGLSLTFEGTIRCMRFQFCAWVLPHTETLAPVSAIGDPIQLLIITDALKSLERLDLSLGSTLFLDYLTRKMFISYMSSLSVCVLSICVLTDSAGIST